MPGYLVSDGVLRELREWTTKARNAVEELRRAATAGHSTPPRMVEFRNDSGETIPAYGAMRVISRTLVGNRRILTVGKPDSTFNRNYLINGERSVANNDTGHGTWLHDSGYVACESSAAAFGEWWGPKPGQWTLAKDYYGFLLVSGAEEKQYMSGGSAATTQAAIARQFMVNQVLAKTDAAVAKSASGVCSVYIGTPGSESDTTINISAVYNKFGSIALGKWVWVNWNGGHPYMVAAEC